ncbi:Ferredoxin, 2Fe-2S [Chondromyces apiculatus DSM 436]|uniref:Ferredoxin, 2Fe-2S n=2 Tax=Chondromyces apiculatus TaxID=51 RepID=A0A017T007_9BACT|nr:Ferredoxin, 2Fe-2S [Chondromyces apiculatus DSM 436]
MNASTSEDGLLRHCRAPEARLSARAIHREVHRMHDPREDPMAKTAIKIDQSISSQHWLDQAADPLQKTLHPIIHRSRGVADALHGRWLGHPLHSVLTDLPVGAWMTAQAFDMAGLLGSSRSTRSLQRSADILHALGLAGAMAAAVAGMADWSDTRGDAKRLGFVHGMTNLVVAGLYGASLVARKRSRRTLGITLSTVGFGLLGFSAWLGGELSYRHGVGMRGKARRRTKASPDQRDVTDASLPQLHTLGPP